MMARPIVALLVAGLLGAWVGADDSAPLQAGRDVPPPATRKIVEPTYPPEAYAAGLGGIVIVEIVIDEQGNVVSARATRSIPGLDEAALSAVRQWKYEVTRVDGKPVRVRHVVPITFSRRLPAVRRQKGIPELRQGSEPQVLPSWGLGSDSVQAAVEVTLAANGAVESVDRLDGASPWIDSLVAATREWRFAPGSGDERVSFRVVATFVGRGSGAPRVELELTGLRVTSLTTATPDADTEPGSAPAATAEGPSTAPSAATPEPSQATPAEGGPAEVAPPPDVEVIAGAVVPQAPPSEPAVPGSSAVANVSLGVGVPDLISGRQPIVPPLARLENVTGKVDILFSVDAAGRCTVQGSDGPERLTPQAVGAVGSWKYRRTTANRLLLLAHFEYTDEGATATVALRRPDQP